LKRVSVHLRCHADVQFFPLRVGEDHRVEPLFVIPQEHVNLGNVGGESVRLVAALKFACVFLSVTHGQPKKVDKSAADDNGAQNRGGLERSHVSLGLSGEVVEIRHALNASNLLTFKDFNLVMDLIRSRALFQVLVFSLSQGKFLFECLNLHLLRLRSLSHSLLNHLLYRDENLLADWL